MPTHDASLAARLAALRGPPKPPPSDTDLNSRFEKLFSHAPGDKTVTTKPDGARAAAVASSGTGEEGETEGDEEMKTEGLGEGDEEDYEVKARDLLKLTKEWDEEAGKDIKTLVGEAEEAGRQFHGRGVGEKGDEEEMRRLLKQAEEEGWSTTEELGFGYDDDWEGEPSWLVDAATEKEDREGGWDGEKPREEIQRDEERCYRSSAPSPEPVAARYGEGGGYNEKRADDKMGLELPSVPTLPAVPKELRTMEEKQEITELGQILPDAPVDDEEADAIVRRIKEEIEWETRHGIKDADDEDDEDSDDKEPKGSDSDNHDSGDEAPGKRKPKTSEKTATKASKEDDDTILSKLSARFAALGGMGKKSSATTSKSITPTDSTSPPSGGLLDLPSVPTGLSLPSAPSSAPGTSTPKKNKKKQEEEVDEVDTWCCICTEDAEWRCEGCEGDIYCGTCIYEAHTGAEEKRHRWGRYVRPGRRLVGA